MKFLIMEGENIINVEDKNKQLGNIIAIFFRENENITHLDFSDSCKEKKCQKSSFALKKGRKIKFCNFFKRKKSISVVKTHFVTRSLVTRGSILQRIWFVLFIHDWKTCGIKISSATSHTSIFFSITHTRL